VGGPKGPSVWISRRSDLAPSNPGRWDTLIAGGRAAGNSLEQTALQEGWEEAGIGPDLMKGLHRIGELAVQYVSVRGFHQELLVIYDLALPDDFHAVCRDGEIEESIRLPFRELTARLADPREFKFSSYLVLTDLVARHPMAGAASQSGG
jgi:8-oxo-dGTP pyrophosphatase MutT (NUDIX family)